MIKFSGSYAAEHYSGVSKYFIYYQDKGRQGGALEDHA